MLPGFLPVGSPPGQTRRLWLRSRIHSFQSKSMPCSLNVCRDRVDPFRDECGGGGNAQCLSFTSLSYRKFAAHVSWTVFMQRKRRTRRPLSLIQNLKKASMHGLGVFYGWSRSDAFWKSFFRCNSRVPGNRWWKRVSPRFSQGLPGGVTVDKIHSSVKMCQRSHKDSQKWRLFDFLHFYHKTDIWRYSVLHCGGVPHSTVLSPPLFMIPTLFCNVKLKEMWFVSQLGIG